MQEDEVEPECEDCPISTWDADTRKAMALYERACPWGDLEHAALAQALEDLEVPAHKRRLMRRILPAIHREIKKTQNQQPENL